MAEEIPTSPADGSALIALGDKCVNVTVSAVAMPPINPLESLIRAQPREPDFGLRVLDGPTWPMDLARRWGLPERGTIARSESGRFLLTVDPDEEAVSVLDIHRRQCLVWVRALKEMPYWAAASPFRIPLSWMAAMGGMVMLHAAAAGRRGDAFLFLGPSGSGKSTSAFISRHNGLTVVGDDLVLLSPRGVYPVYSRAKLNSDMFLKLADSSLRSVHVPCHGEKHVVCLDVSDAEPWAVRGLLFPRLVKTNAEPRCLSAGEAFKRMATSTFDELRGGSMAPLTPMKRLCATTPAFDFPVTVKEEDAAQSLARLWDAVSIP